MIDSNTGSPVQGASVSASYPAESWLFQFIHPSSKGITDEQGKVTLDVYCARGFGPFFEIEIVNELYYQEVGLFHSENEWKEWMGRPKDYVPSKPDTIVEITSRIDVAQAEQQREEKKKADEAAAEQLFQEAPDFWPEHKGGGHPFIVDAVGAALVRKRWDRSSRVALNPSDTHEAICAVVLQHMKHPQSRVDEIRWVSPAVVMVSSSWYTSPIASAGYTYILKKADKGWVVLTYYMNYIS